MQMCETIMIVIGCVTVIGLYCLGADLYMF